MSLATILLATQDKPLFIKSMSGKTEKVSHVASTLPPIQVGDLVSYTNTGAHVIVLDALGEHHPCKLFEQQEQQLVLHWGRISIIIHEKNGISVYQEQKKHFNLSATAGLTTQNNALYFQSKKSPLRGESPLIKLSTGE